MVIFQAWNVVCLVQRNDSKKNNSVTKSRIRRPWAVKFIRNWLTHNKPGLRVWACLSNKSGKKDNEKIRRGLVLSTSQPSMKKHLVCLVIYRWWWIRSESRFSSRCCFLYVHIFCCCSSCLWLHCSFFNCDVRKISLFETIFSYAKETVNEVQSLLRLWTTREALNLTLKIFIDVNTLSIEVMPAFGISRITHPRKLNNRSCRFS